MSMILSDIPIDTPKTILVQNIHESKVNSKATPFPYPYVNVDLEDIFKNYLVKDNEVYLFVKENPFLIPFLKELPKIVADYFYTCPLKLTLYHDFEENYLKLVVNIITDLPNQSILKQRRLLSKDKSFQNFFHLKEINTILMVDFILL